MEAQEVKTVTGVCAEPLTRAKINSSVGIYCGLRAKSVNKQHTHTNTGRHKKG